MIKLFASDLDGTLLKNNQPDKVINETIKQVLDSNKYFVIATGRLMFKEHVKLMKFEQYNLFTICLNGALMLDSKRKELYRKEIDSTFLKKLFSEFHEIPFEFITADKILISKSKETFVNHIRENDLRTSKLQGKKLDGFLRNCLFNISSEEIVQRGVLKINGHINDSERLNKFQKFLNDNSDFIINSPYEENQFFEMTDNSVSKGNALIKLIDQLGISEDEVAVYGDGPNDIDMLSKFKYSYAPENATEKVKKVVNEVVESCEEYGVSKHIKKTLSDY